MNGNSEVRAAAYAWLARLRGSHTAAEEAAFQHWFAAAPEHAAAYENALQTWALAGLLEAPRADSQLLRLLRKPNLLHRSPGVLVAASLFLMLIVVFAVDQLVTPGASVEASMLTSKVGQVRNVALSEGSRLTLDTDTKVSVEIDRHARTFRLEQGRARFGIAPDLGKPLRILAGRAVITAPAGIVEIEERDGAIQVSSLRGTATVSRGDAPTTWAVSAGGKLVLDRSGPAPRRMRLTAAELRWPSGMLSFEDVPLFDVIAATNRYGPPRIALADQQIGRLRFTGTVRAGEQSALANVLAAAFHLRAEQQAPNAIRLRRSTTKTGRPRS